MIEGGDLMITSIKEKLKTMIFVTATVYELSYCNEQGDQFYEEVWFNPAIGSWCMYHETCLCDPYYGFWMQCPPRTMELNEVVDWFEFRRQWLEES
jgi:hypothetical protein